MFSTFISFHSQKWPSVLEVQYCFEDSSYFSSDNWKVICTAYSNADRYLRKFLFVAAHRRSEEFH